LQLRHRWRSVYRAGDRQYHAAGPVWPALASLGARPPRPPSAAPHDCYLIAVPRDRFTFSRGYSMRVSKLAAPPRRGRAALIHRLAAVALAAALAGAPACGGGG